VRTPELMARLERHYIAPGPMPGGIFVPECGWNPGGGSRCDAIYVGFTSTSGRRLVGHEVKVSRADWRAELAKQGKADPWHDQCHEWYVVAPDTDVVPPEELPHGWGLLTADGKTRTRLRVAVGAVTRDVTPSWKAVRSVMARYDTLRAEQIHQGRQELERKIRTEYEQRRLDRAEREKIPPAYRTAHEMVERLREQGIDLKPNAWAPGEVDPDTLAYALAIAQSVRGLTAGWQKPIEQVQRTMRDLDSDLQRLMDSMKGAP
jgi:hypothetical protein